jgi:hypothetical protein
MKISSVSPENIKDAYLLTAKYTHFLTMLTRFCVAAVSVHLQWYTGIYRVSKDMIGDISCFSDEYWDRLHFQGSIGLARDIDR